MQRILFDKIKRSENAASYLPKRRVDDQVLSFNAGNQLKLRTNKLTSKCQDTVDN